MAEKKEANTIEYYWDRRDFYFSSKNSSSLDDAPLRPECIGAELGDEDRNLTIAEKYCVLTSGDDDVEGLSSFVAERLQCLSEGSVEKLIRDECVNVEEIL